MLVLTIAFASSEVVERRTYTVTGQKASPEEIDRLIETGESETIFAKAILEQGRGHVRGPLSDLRAEFPTAHMRAHASLRPGYSPCDRMCADRSSCPAMFGQ